MRFLIPLVLLSALPVAADDLAVGEGDVYVRAHCGGCHSLELVTSQRGDRAFWLKTIRWMQKTQNLWAIPPEQEALILDYLATHYNEEERGRRPSLDADLLPTSPAHHR
ncbi:MAG: hypothetical protein AAF660_08370 [Pseudomonadota bacterium]